MISSWFHLTSQSSHNDCLTRYAVSRYTLADNGCDRKCLIVYTFSTLLQDEFSNTFCIPFHQPGLSATFHGTYYFFSSYFQSRFMKFFTSYFTFGYLSILFPFHLLFSRNCQRSALYFYLNFSFPFTLKRTF